jgi:hypothetical protein
MTNPIDTRYAVAVARTCGPDAGEWPAVFVSAVTFTTALVAAGAPVENVDEALTAALGLGFHELPNPYVEVPPPADGHETWRVSLPTASDPGGVYGLRTVAIEPLVSGDHDVPAYWRAAVVARRDHCHLFITSGVLMESWSGEIASVMTDNREAVRVLGMTVPAVRS